MSNGFGQQLWGVSPFGGGVTPLSLTKAVAIATRTVRVTLSTPPPQVSAALPGDVLNPRSWRVWRTDTNRNFTVLGVTPYTTTIFDVLIVEPLGSNLVTHRVSYVLASTSVLPFLGLASEAAVAPPGEFDRDIKNPPAPTDTALGGAWSVTGGDYDQESGEALVRKLVLRRWTTDKGEFLHLPAYGFGLMQQVKRPFLTSRMTQLAADMQREAKLEREVADAVVRLSFDAGAALLMVDAALLLRAGKTIRMPLRVDVRQGTITL